MSNGSKKDIDSGKAAEGQTYAAEVAKDVLDANGDVVIPPKPTGELSDGELDKVAGGGVIDKFDTFCGCCC